MVLHHVADDAVVVEVAATAVHAERLLEDDLHIADEGPTPQRADDHVGEARDEQILHHFLSQVVVNSLCVTSPTHGHVNIVFGEKLLDVVVQLLACVVIATEGLLHNQAVESAVVDAGVFALVR